MNCSGARHAIGLLSAVLLTIAGCSSGSGQKMGRISLGVSDGPVHEATKVCVAFDEIEFMSQGTSTVEPLVPVMNVNLLDFQGMNAAPLLFDFELPAGEYQWLRLGVIANQLGAGGTGNDATTTECQGEESYLAINDTVYNFYVPSGFETGLKMVGGFAVPVDSLANFTVEFDLMQSVTLPTGLSPDTVLRPTVRLVANAEAGALTGEVSSDLAAATGCAPSVFVFNNGVTPNAIDMDGMDASDPVATAIVNKQLNDLEQTEWHYTVGYLLGGHYEAAFTCDDGATFEPSNGYPTEIFAGQVSEVDFE